MSDFKPTHGTDNGPECWRCKGTVWGYRVRHKHVAGLCMGCHVVEGPIAYAGADPTIAELVAAHRTFLEAE